MSKNLTRKGIAFGALVALGTTLIAGAPASAAGITGTSKVSLLPTTGTEYTVLLKSDASRAFSLKGTVANSLRGASAVGLKWFVTDADRSVTITTDGDDSAAGNGTSSVGAFSTTTNKALVKADDYDANIVITAAAGTTTKTVDITAWYDDNNNDVIDTDEYEVTRTVKFLKPSELVVATSLTSPSVGDNKLEAIITTTPVLNGEQVIAAGSTPIDANFTRQGSATVVTASAVTGATTTWDDTKKQFTVSLPSYLTTPGAPWASLTFARQQSSTVAVVDGNTTTANGTNTATVTANGHGLANGKFVKLDSTSAFADGWGTVANTATNSFTFDYPDDGSTTSNAVASGNVGYFTEAFSASDVDVVDSNTTTANGTNTATVTSAAHGLKTGDYIFYNSYTSGKKYVNTGQVPVKVTVTGVNTFTFTKADDGTTTSNTFSDDTAGLWTLATVATIAGQYSAKALVQGVAAGTEQGVGVVAATAADTKATVVGSATNTSLSEHGTAASTGAVKVLKGTTTAIPVTVALYKSDSTAVAAGVVVKATVSGVTGTVTVNGTKVANGDEVSATTTAAGTVSYSVASSTAATSDAVTLEFNSEGLVGAAASKISLTWEAATLALVDLNEPTSSSATYNAERTIVKGGNVAFKLAMLNQFGSYITGDYRAKVVTTGRTAGTSFVDFVGGVATVTVTDNAIVGQTNIVVTTVDIEKKVSGTWQSDEEFTATSGFLEEWATNAAGGQKTINVIDAQTDKIQLSTSTTTYGGNALVASGDFSTGALLASGDNRLRGEDESATSAIRIGGNVVNANTLGARKSATVTVTGPSNVVFNVGDLYGAGSLTFLANADGGFEIRAISNVAQKDSVVTVTSGNATAATTKITFNKAADDTGKTLTITAPTLVKSGSTAVVTVALKDKFGNAVVTDSATAGIGYVNGATATAPTIKVTYTGPGFVTTTIPSVTDANGEIKFVVLLGANDAGSATVAASYDSNGADTDVAGTTLTASATAQITIGAAPVAAATAAVSGSTGKFFVSATNAAGKKVVVKVAGKFFGSFTGTAAKKSVALKAPKGSHKVTVFVGGKLVATKTVTVK